MRHMIELRRIIYRTEESRQIVEEGIVATADEGLDRKAVGRVDRQYFINIDNCRKTAPRKIDKSYRCSIISIGGHANLC